MLVTTYQYPVIGTTPPTAAQMAVPGGIATLITAQISMLDADTTGVLVHNMGLTSTEQQRLFPIIDSYFTTMETAYPFLTFNPTPGNVANAVTVGKTGGSGTGFTANVYILRPHTIIQ